jgi:hypothetical protein
VYKEFQSQIEGENIHLQHTCEEFEEISKVCLAHIMPSLIEKIKSIGETVSVTDVFSIVHSAAEKILTERKITEICVNIGVYDGDNYVGSVYSGEYATHSIFTLKRLKKNLVEKTLDKVAKDIGSEICQGILKHIQTKVQQNFEHYFKRIEISLPLNDFQTVFAVIGTILVSFFSPLVGIIFAVVTFAYTAIMSVDINSRSWRTTVADEIYKNIRKQRSDILRKIVPEIEEICQKTIVHLQKSQEFLKNEKLQIERSHQERKYSKSN